MKNSESKSKGSAAATIKAVDKTEVILERIEASINPRTIIDIDDQEELEIEEKYNKSFNFKL